MAALRPVAVGFLAFAAAFLATRTVVGPRNLEVESDRRGPNAFRAEAPGSARPPAKADGNETLQRISDAKRPPVGNAPLPNTNSTGSTSSPTVTKDGVIAGTIVDFEGTPARGARVLWVTKEGNPRGSGVDVRADSTGRFELPILMLNDSSRPCWILVRYPHRFDLVFGPFEVAAGGRTDAGVIRLEGAGRVKVRVRDPEGRPVSNIVVTLDDLDEPPTGTNVRWGSSNFRKSTDRFRMSGITGEDGTLVLEPVWSGRSVVWVEPPNPSGPRQKSLGFDPPSKAIEVVAGREELLDWVAPKSATLSGRATAHGKPLVATVLTLVVPGGAWTWYPVRATTDANGAFAFPPVPPGEYAARRGDYASHFEIAARVNEVDDPVEVPRDWVFRYERANQSEAGDDAHKIILHEGANSADFDFGGGATLEVAVVDARNQQPVAGALVRVFAAPAASAVAAKGYERRDLSKGALAKPSFDRRATSGSAGKVSWEDMPEGRWRLAVHASGFRRAQSEVLVGPTGDGHTTIALEVGAAIRGKVVNTDGSPIQGVDVSLVPEGDDLEPIYRDANIFETSPPHPHATARDDGSFELTGAAPGNQRILAYCATHAPVVVDVNVPASGALEGVVIPLEKFGRFLVSARRGGAPIQQFRAGIERVIPGTPIPPEAWHDDRFFETIGAFADFVGSQGGVDASGVIAITRVPPGEWTIDATEIPPKGERPKPPVRTKARAVAGSDVPVYVEFP